MFEYLRKEDEASMDDLSRHIENTFNLTEVEKSDRYPSGDIKFQNIIRFALLFFKKAKLVESPKRGLYKLTEDGKNFISFSSTEFENLRKQISSDNNRQKRLQKKQKPDDLTKNQPNLFDYLKKEFGEIKNIINLSKMNYSDTYLVCEGLNAKAIGISNGKSFTVFKDSVVRANDTKSLKETYKKLREELVAQKILEINQKNNKEYIFSQNHTFDSASAASSVVLARQSNGLVDWKTPSKISLGGLSREEK